MGVVNGAGPARGVVNEQKVDLLLDMLKSADVTDTSEEESKTVKQLESELFTHTHHHHNTHTHTHTHWICCTSFPIRVIEFFILTCQNVFFKCSRVYYGSPFLLSFVKLCMYVYRNSLLPPSLPPSLPLPPSLSLPLSLPLPPSLPPSLPLSLPLSSSLPPSPSLPLPPSPSLSLPLPPSLPPSPSLSLPPPPSLPLSLPPSSLSLSLPSSRQVRYSR